MSAIAMLNKAPAPEWVRSLLSRTLPFFLVTTTSVLVTATSSPASFAAVAAPQVNWQPVPAPSVSAAPETWYIERSPIPYAGDLYYPAGARVFFDGYRMIPAGDYAGIPLFVDTTVEPYSQILVPVGSGLMQPYERLRAGSIAGTTGSSPPHFPVEVPGTPWEKPATTGQLPRAHGAAAGSAAEPAGPGELAVPGERVGTAGERTARRQQSQTGPVESVRQPSGPSGIWVSYAGRRWRSAGEAIRLASSGLRVIGEYHGFPVFGMPGNDRVIYLPGGEGIVAPFEQVRSLLPPLAPQM